MGQGLCLHLQINLGIDVRGINRDVAEPSTDRVDVDAGSEEVYCSCVANNVRTDLPRSESWVGR